jgi:hypothetical protein
MSTAVQQALASVQTLAEAARIAREKREMEQAIAEFRRFKVPQPGPGQIVFMWASDCVVDIECHLDYEPEERQTWEHPGYPENATLCAAYLRGVDIYEMLSEKQILRIEEAALLKHGEVTK